MTAKHRRRRRGNDDTGDDFPARVDPRLEQTDNAGEPGWQVPQDPLWRPYKNADWNDPGGEAAAAAQGVPDA